MSEAVKPDMTLALCKEMNGILHDSIDTPFRTTRRDDDGDWGDTPVTSTADMRNRIRAAVAILDEACDVLNRLDCNEGCKS